MEIPWDPWDPSLSHSQAHLYFKAIRLLSGKRKEVTGTTIHKSDGSPCLSEEETLERWREHFISALNHHPGVPSNELDNEAASTPVNTSVPIDEPSVEEVYAAIKRLRNGRAPKPDCIPPEFLKCANPNRRDRRLSWPRLKSSNQQLEQV